MQDAKIKKAQTDFFWSFEPLYVISKILSINPYRYGSSFSTLTRWDKIYGYAVIIFVITLMLLSMLVRILHTYNTMFLSMIILDFSTSVLQLILVLLSVWNAVKRHADKIKSFFRKLTKVDRILVMLTKDYEASRRLLYVKCAAITATTLIFAVAETFLWSKLRDPVWGVIITYSVKYLMFYYKFVIFLQVQTRVQVLLERFRHANKVLRDNTSHKAEVATIASNVCLKEIATTKSARKIELHTIFESHNMLCDLVDIINDMHGFQILIIVCSVIVAILNLLNTGIILVLSALVGDDQVNFKFEYAALGIQGTFCLGFIMMSIFMAAQCSSTVEEANETKAIAQKLLLEVPIIITNETNSDRYMYREELVLFINTSRSPTFSAGGFFTVDYTLLLAIMGAVTSYFIVLLQFANVKGNKIV